VLAADAVPEWIAHLYYYAWFVGFLVSGIAYILLMQAYKPGVATIKETSSYVAID
jgi:nucleobase:cation symporter-1, NCS1 family